MLFTIVIPTRNRPELAEFAVRSALRQDSPEFDVLVSDNSSPRQADQLRHVVEQIGDRRVRYVRPMSELGMGAHWEFAVPQATGDYVGVLTDRMAFKRDALSRLATEIRGHNVNVIAYSSSALIEPSPPYRLQRPPFTGRLDVIDSRLALRLIALSIPPWGVPTMLNTFVSRRLLQEMLSNYPDVFTGAAPDQSFCMHALDWVAEYHYLDVPVMIAHGVTSSNGNAMATGQANEASREFITNLQSKGGLAYTPIPGVMTNHNVIINEYCRMKAIQRSGRFGELDLARYCDRLDAELAAQGRDQQGPDRLLVEKFRREHGLRQAARPAGPQLGRLARSEPARRIAQAASDLLGVNPTNRPVGSFASVGEALAYDEGHPPKANSAVSGFLRRTDRLEAETEGIKVG